MVRVRIAPSPTGHFHIGNARTALFNWLYARHTGGTFIVRIEDTDRERNSPESLEVVLSSLRWLGLNWDEGPEVGGESGPYFQSQRDAIYKEYLERLRDIGRAYDKDGAVYFRVSGEDQTIEDAVRGKVVRREEKDFVIFRSDGTPIYHFAVVVDDIAMGITHVIRGEEHLSNTSKHTELFAAMGAQPPIFAHVPLILKSHGPGKMGKRDWGFQVGDYERRLFLSSAVRNYLCLLGWSPKDNREVLSIDETIDLFDFPGINKDAARFDERKLAFINVAHLRELSLESFVSLARPILIRSGTIEEGSDENYIKAVLQLCQEKVRSFEELPDYVYYFFREDFSFLEKAERKIMGKGEPLSRLREVLPIFEAMNDFSEEALENKLGKLAESMGLYTGDYIHPTRLAVSGTNAGPGIYALIRVLGRDRTLSRIRRFLDKRSGEEEG